LSGVVSISRTAWRVGVSPDKFNAYLAVLGEKIEPFLKPKKLT
jgi:hypothetical protein